MQIFSKRWRKISQYSVTKWVKESDSPKRYYFRATKQDAVFEHLDRDSSKEWKEEVFDVLQYHHSLHN